MCIKSFQLRLNLRLDNLLLTCVRAVGFVRCRLQINAERFFLVNSASPAARVDSFTSGFMGWFRPAHTNTPVLLVLHNSQNATPHLQCAFLSLSFIYAQICSTVTHSLYGFMEGWSSSWANQCYVKLKVHSYANYIVRTNQQLKSFDKVLFYRSVAK